MYCSVQASYYHIRERVSSFFLRDPVIFFFTALNGGRVRINRAQGRNTVEKECVWHEKDYLAFRCLRGGGRSGKRTVRRRRRIGAGPPAHPLLRLEQRRHFYLSGGHPALCVLSAAVYLFRGGLDLLAALPYLIGGTVGGWLGGRWFRGVRVVWLRRAFGLLLLYGGAEVPAVSEWVLPLLAGGAAGCCPASEWGAGRCFWCI